MSGDIRSILERMTAIEAELTPVTVKSGLNRQQKSVDQLPALFRPRKISVLGAKTDPEHPVGKHLVGASESSLIGQAMVSKIAAEKFPEPVAKSIGSAWPNQSPNSLSETIADIEEDMLSRMRQDLNNYLDKLSDRVSDDGKRDRKPQGSDKLGQKTSQELGLINKDIREVATEPPVVENKPCRVMALEDGSIVEIHGDDTCGYEVRRGTRRISKRFPSLELAETMLDLFRAHRADRSLEQDYVDEK